MSHLAFTEQTVKRSPSVPSGLLGCVEYLTLETHWKHRCEICHESGRFQTRLLVLPLFFLFLSLRLTVQRPPTVSATDRPTDTQGKRGNNGRTSAFILMKGINAGAFTLSMPPKSPPRPCPPLLAPSGPSY